MKPVVDRLRANYEGRVDFQVFAQIDAAPDGRDLADAHGVTAVPTMMLVSPQGVEMARWVGGVPEPTLFAALDRAVSE